MTDCVVSVVILGNDWLEEIEEISEILSEELGLDLCDFIEFNHHIFENGLFIGLEGLDCNLSH